MRRIRKPTLIAVLLAVAGVAGWRTLQGGWPTADFTATDFHAVYGQCSTAGRFVDRSVSVRGAVASVGSGFLTPAGGQTVTLGAGRSGVVCNFRATEVHQADRLFVGQVVVIRGTCTGDIMGFPMLEDCLVESVGFWPAR